MKQIGCVLVFIFLISCTSKPQFKMPSNQRQIAAFIKKYQDSVLTAPDSATKTKIFLNMWGKHVKFIQDSLKISISTIDTFIFQNAVVREFIGAKDGKRYLHLFLDNGNYATEAIYRGVQDKDLRESDIYKMIKNLKPNTPIKAVGTLKGLSLSRPNVEEGIKKIILDFRLDCVYNSNSE
jgi:hypothetical protein